MNDLLQMEQPPVPIDVSCSRRKTWKDLLWDVSGQDMIEYVLAAALISLLAVSAMNGLGTKISAAYTSISSNLTSST